MGLVLEVEVVEKEERVELSEVSVVDEWKEGVEVE